MSFLFMFLPAALILYYVCLDRFKEYVLLALSLLFYAAGSLKYAALFVVEIAVTIAIGRLINRTENKKTRAALLVSGICINAGLLIYYKYTDFAIDTVNDLLGSDIALRNLMLPLGISFFTFKAISYLADIYKGTAELSKDPVHDALYLSIFTQITSGPLTRYNDLRYPKELEGVKGGRMTLFSDGVYRFMIGFNKKILLANILANITDEIFSASAADFSIAYAWLGSISYSLQLYYDFAGYSDMAVGISEMFGLQCMENFRFPYMTESISKFWRRWHISLSQWFRDYVYIPMGGSHAESKYKVYFNLFVVWALTGIWHGANWTFIMWGLGYFVMISFERMTGLPDKIKNKAGRICYRIFTLIFINMEWVLFRSENITQGLSFVKKLFICPANPLADSRTLFLIGDYWPFLMAAILLCFPVVTWISSKTEETKALHSAYELAKVVLVSLLFIWSISFVVSGQNNPFAYANF